MKIFFSSEKILFCENKKNQTINKDSTRLYFNTSEKLTNIFECQIILKIYWIYQVPQQVLDTSFTNNLKILRRRKIRQNLFTF